MESKYSCLKSVLENEPFSETRMKRKFRTSLTVKNKLEVIEYATLHPNATQSKIASYFGIDRTTVSKVLKRKADILNYADQFNESSSELVCTSLMKKGSPSREGSSSPTVKKPPGNNNVPTGTKSKVARPLVPKSDVKAVSPNATPSQKRQGNKSSSGDVLNSLDLKGDVYHPELSGKCESWFMEQNLSPNKEKKTHEHIASIRSFSKLLSVIPLSDCECFKILAGKCVKDACMSFVRKVTQELMLSGRSIGNRSYELLHRFLLEGMPELNLEQYYCNGFTAFEADDVKRIWVKYVQPKLHQLHNENSKSFLPVTSINNQDMELTVQVTPEQAPDINDNSVSNSPGFEENDLFTNLGEIAVVRGSRKRKMNSKPVKMVAADSDSNGNDQMKDGYDDTHDGTDYSLNQSNYLTKDDISQHPFTHNFSFAGNILAAKSPNENIAPENLVVPNKKRRSNGVNNQEKTMGIAQDLTVKRNISEYPVIEIKPDGCSDDERKSKNASNQNTSGVNSTLRSSNKDPLDNSAVVSFTNATHLILAYTKSLEERINKIENAKSESLQNDNEREKLFQINLADKVMKKCNESMKQLMNSFTDQVSQLRNQSEEKPGCSCQCTQLKEKVEQLENKIDTLQGSFDKLYEAVTASK